MFPNNKLLLKLFGGIFLKFIVHAFLTIMFTFAGTQLLVSAQVPQEEINHMLTEMNLTMEELKDYLAYHEKTLEEFETIEELKAELGTPITEENLATLLQTYNLTNEGLQSLLGEFGDTLDDYHFIEDLEIAIDFYQNNDEELAGIEDYLAQIGLTEEEVDKLFTHFMSLDEVVLEQEMERLMALMEPYLDIEDPAQLTEEQQQQLISIWDEMLTAFHIKANYYLVNGAVNPISFADLMKLETLNGKSLRIELTDLEGNLLVDMQVSEDMIGSDFVVDAGENLAEVGDMAGELTIKLHNAKLPDTASSFGLNVIIGLLLALAGFIFYQYSRKMERA
jgi:processed acidic surface protein